MATKASSETASKDRNGRSSAMADNASSPSLTSTRDNSQTNCFFKACDREASEKLLSDSYASNKQKNGIYLLRQSNRDENKFILSLIKDGECFHYRAHHAGNGTFLDEKTDSIFYSLDELLEYYHTDGARHLRCPLTTALRGQPLPAFAQRRGVSTVLHQAATEGQRDVITLLLDDPSCPDIHAKNEEGNTPLHEAAFFGRDDAVKVLLKAGANWKFVNKLGWTSLHQAALGNCPTVIDLLITRSQADPDIRNPFNLYAPLHCASACNNVESIATLIAHDAPLRPLTDEGETPYDLAVKFNGTECIEKLDSAHSKPASSRRSNYYHGSLSNSHMRAILNYFKKQDGYFLVRQSSTAQDDYAISIIWHGNLVHVKLYKKNNNSYYFEDRLHYHDTLEHAIDYFMKSYKTVIRPLSPETAKVAYANEPSPSMSQQLFSFHNKPPKLTSGVSTDSASFDGASPSAGNPFARTRTQPMHNKQKILPTIEQRLVNPLVNKKVVAISEDQITVGKVLGEGNFGKVFAGEYFYEHGKKVPVALKAIKATNDPRSKDDMKKEAFVMKELSHPCIVRLYGICQSRKLGSTLMVQELLSMGSLLDYLKKHVNSTSARSLFSMWITQMIHGMAYMERKRFVHRDLAARNILMQSHSRIKISDFGLSRPVDSGDYYVQQSETPVPVAWYAPECLTQLKFTSKSDVWSFGVTAWEIYTYGQCPYLSIPNEEMHAFIASGGRLQRPQGCSSSVFDVIRRCWAHEPHDRPSFPDLLKILSNRTEFVTAIQTFHSLSKY